MNSTIITMQKAVALTALLLSMLLIVPAAVSAQETDNPEIPDLEVELEAQQVVEPETPQNLAYFVGAPEKPPRWSLEIKGGDFEPDLDEWRRFFGDETASEFGVAFGYKLTRWLEVGLEADYIRDKGAGRLPSNDTVGGSVTYNLFPAHVYVLVRGIFHENQRFVPYVGGGFTRAYYRQKIDNQASRRGDTDGEHARAGLQILLDWIDRGSAGSMQSELGVNNTYLILEVQKFSAEIDGIELGGESAMVGFLFEF